MKDMMIYAVCAFVIVVLDILVSKRILKALFTYAGTTFDDMQKHFKENEIHFSHASGRYAKRKAMAYRERVISDYIREYSANPQSAMKLFNLYKYSTLPIPIAVSFVLFEKFADNKSIMLLFYLVLLLAVIAFLIILEVLKKKHPIDEIELERLDEKRSRQEKPNFLAAKIFFSIAVIIVVAAPFISRLAVGGAVTVKKPQQPARESVKLDCADINRSMTALGFEFDNENAHYSFYQNGRIVDYVVGKKGTTVFEFYYYDNHEIAESFYNYIINEIAPTAENYGNVFTISVNGVSYYTACKENTAVFAFSKNGYDEIDELLNVSRYNEYLKSVPDEMPAAKQGFILPDWAAEIICYLIFLLFVFIARGSCNQMLHASANTTPDDFEKFEGSNLELLKEICKKSKRKLITVVYAVLGYVVFAPWIVFVLISIASHFISVSQSIISSFANWMFVVYFFSIVFNWLVAGVLRKLNNR